MKRLFLFCTKIRYYLTEIPLMIFLLIVRHFNDEAEGLLKLYPLQIFIVLLMLFIFVYFFRLISVSYEEVRYHGLFSSRDSAVLNEGKTLILTLSHHSRLNIEVFGNDGHAPILDSLKEQGSIDIFLFRGKAIGGRRKASRIMRYFGVSDEGVRAVFSENSFSSEYELVSLTSELREDVRIIKMRLKETV